MHLRFTIRDLLWLAAVVALALGWWIENQKLHSRIAELNAILRKWDIGREESYDN
jgi:hypothetical protein